MMNKVAQANQLMQAQRIIRPEEHVLGMLPDEFVYQYRVFMFGKEWTIYKSYSCFKELRDDVIKIFTPGLLTCR